MMDPITIHTIGYGEDRPCKAAFLSRIHSYIPKGTLFIDIRKAYSRSKYGAWAFWGSQKHVVKGVWEPRSAYMGDLLAEEGMVYKAVPGLSNPYGSKKGDFEKYRKALIEGPKARCLEELVGFITDRRQAKTRRGEADDTYALVCVEKLPFEPSGAVHCHRVLVAQRIKELLTERGDWDADSVLIIN